MMPSSLLDAACIGADPRLFDSIGGDPALDALSYCERCPVTRSCEDWVKPKKSHFDGVAGGRVWQEGKPVDVGLFSEGVT